jgi:hypothetical protein
MDRTDLLVSKVRRVRLSVGSTLLILLVLPRCGRTIESAEVPGAYRSECAFAVTELKLLPDGTFTEHIRLTGSGEVTDHTGLWRYDAGAQRLTLDKCLDVNDGFRQLNKEYRTPMVCNLPVVHSWSRNSIRLGSDEGIPYWKVPSSQPAASR